MVEITPGVFIGTAFDWENDIKEKDGWAVIHACKEPYHRELLGYTTRSAPKDSPEYLIAKRGNELYLNLIDAPMVEYIPKEIIQVALEFIEQKVKEGKKVLVHCNQGESRAPSIGYLYLIKSGKQLDLRDFKEIYPDYNPGIGMKEFVDLYLQGKI